MEDEDVTLVSVVMSKDALETLTDEAEDMKVVRRDKTRLDAYSFSGILCRRCRENGNS